MVEREDTGVTAAREGEGEREREHVFARERVCVCVCVCVCEALPWQPVGVCLVPGDGEERRGGERDERRGENYPSLRVRGGWGKEIMEGRGKGGIPPHLHLPLFVFSPSPVPCSLSSQASPPLSSRHSLCSFGSNWRGLSRLRSCHMGRFHGYYQVHESAKRV